MNNKWIEFNIHNAAAFRVASDAPTAPLLKDMFEPFLTEGLDHYDLSITGKFRPVKNASHGETEFRYTDNSLYVNETNVQILLDESGFWLNGTRELLVSVIPLLDKILVDRGVSWIHAATVEYNGKGICLPAWGGVGKTSTIAKLLKIPGVSFMGDDWAFLSEGADLLGYAKPMFIKPHHRAIYPHLFKKKRKPLVPVRLSRPLGRVATRVHPMLTRYPLFARYIRKFSPEHMMVQPREAFPLATFSTSAPLAIAIFIERFDGSRTILHRKEKPWMVSRMIGNFNAEVSRHSRELMTALGATGLIPIEQAFSEKASVIDRALDGKPTFLLQVPAALSPDQASDIIVEHIQKALSLSGLA